MYTSIAQLPLPACHLCTWLFTLTRCLFVLYTWLFAPQAWHPVVIIKLLIPPHLLFFSLTAPGYQALDPSFTNNRPVLVRTQRRFFCLLHPAVTRQIRTQAACSPSDAIQSNLCLCPGIHYDVAASMVGHSTIRPQN